MARKLLAALVISTALGAVGPAAAGQLPILRSVTVVNRHVVVELSVSGVLPVEFAVATRRVVDQDGSLLRRNVRQRETIRLPSAASTVARWRSAKALRAGVYFVQVEAVDTGGVTDCPPKTTKCGEHFSNVRRVVVRKST
jgi:hypothetical protein